jgi:hypothetical protein
VAAAKAAATAAKGAAMPPWPSVAAPSAVVPNCCGRPRGETERGGGEAGRGPRGALGGRGGERPEGEGGRGPRGAAGAQSRGAGAAGREGGQSWQLAQLMARGTTQSRQISTKAPWWQPATCRKGKGEVATGGRDDGEGVYWALWCRDDEGAIHLGRSQQVARLAQRDGARALLRAPQLVRGGRPRRPRAQDDRGGGRARVVRVLARELRRRLPLWR